jgi:hypothetical protein
MNVPLQQLRSVLGLLTLTAVIMTSSLFWGMTPCSLMKFNQHLGGTHRLLPAPCWFCVWLTFQP